MSLFILCVLCSLVPATGLIGRVPYDADRVVQLTAEARGWLYIGLNIFLSSCIVASIAMSVYVFLFRQTR